MAFGDVVVGLAVDKRQFDRQMRDTREQFTKVVVDAKRMNAALADTGAASSRAMTGISGGSSRATFALLELSRGAEDAAVVFGTSGLGGAIRASANNLAAMATVINPMAGVVVGLGAALGSVLIPRLLETGEAAETAEQKAAKLADRLAKIREDARSGKTFLFGQDAGAELAQAQGAREGREAFDRFNRRFVGDEATRRGLVSELTGRRDTLAQQRADIDAAIRNRINAPLGFTGGNEALRQQRIEEREKALAELYAQREKVLRELSGVETSLGTAQRLLTEKVRERVAVENAGGGVFRQEQRRKFEEMRERDARLDPNFGDAERLAGLAELQFGRSLLGGIGGQLAGLERQRAFLANDRPTQLPSAVERGQSMSKILELFQARKNAAEQKEQREQIKKLEEQIKLLRKLDETIRERFPELKPSRA